MTGQIPRRAERRRPAWWRSAGVLPLLTALIAISALTARVAARWEEHANRLTMRREELLRLERDNILLARRQSARNRTDATQVNVLRGDSAVAATWRWETLLTLAEAMGAGAEEHGDSWSADLWQQRWHMTQIVDDPFPHGDVPVRSYLIDTKGRLPARFGEFFELDEARVRELEALTMTVVDWLEKRIKANTAVRREGPAVVVMETKPLGDEALAVRSELLGAFRSALGEERFRVFTLLNGLAQADPLVATPVPGDLLGTFGRMEMTVTITRTATGYDFKRITRPPQGSGEGSASVDGLRSSRELHGPGLDLLPPDF